MLEGVAADGVAQTVVHVVHEVAGVDVEDFVESTGNVEAHGIHHVKLFARGHFLGGEPLLVGETELELVAVAEGLRAAEDGLHGGKFHLADAGEVVYHLLLLVAQLVLVGEALPLAAAAHAEVLANGLDAAGRIAVETHHFGFGITVFLFPDLQVYHIAGHGVGHEHHEVVHLGNGLAFGSHVGDFDIFKYGKRLSFSSHDDLVVS